MLGIKVGETQIAFRIRLHYYLHYRHYPQNLLKNRQLETITKIVEENHLVLQVSLCYRASLVLEEKLEMVKNFEAAQVYHKYVHFFTNLPK